MYSRDKQGGQSLILVTVLLGILSMSVLMVFNAGILSNQKTQLQNTADAAAYTAATYVARDLNFKAYTNRAMVANQVAIGQYVGLSSWMEMLYKSAENLATITSWIPYVSQATNAIKQVMNSVNSVAQPLLGSAVTITDFAITGLSYTQQGFHYAMGYASFDAANKVIEENDPKVNFGAVSNGILVKDLGDVWQSFSKQVNTKNDEDFHQDRKTEFRKIVNDSRDPFSKRRTYSWLKLKIPFVIGIDVKKAGGSELVTSGDNEETWTSMDTVAIHMGRFRCRWFKCRWRWREAVPSGWASAIAGEDFSMYAGWNQRHLWGESWRINRTTSMFAASNKNDLGRYSGLQNFYDIKPEGLLEDTPDLRVMIGKSDGDMRTSANTISDVDGELAHWSDGSLDIEEETKLRGNKMSAVSRAEAYFKRPNDVTAMTRRDRRIEFANLYSPYWQARLVDTTRQDRFLAMAVINR